MAITTCAMALPAGLICPVPSGPIGGKNRWARRRSCCAVSIRVIRLYPWLPLPWLLLFLRFLVSFVSVSPWFGSYFRDFRACTLYNRVA